MRFLRHLILSVTSLVAFVLSFNANPERASSFQEPAKDASKKDEEKKPAEKPPVAKQEPTFDKADEESLRRAKLTTDGDVLIQFLQKRILPEAERPQIERLVRELGSPAYGVRERAMLALVKRGTATLEVLRQSPISLDSEVTRRIENAIQQILEKDVSPDVPAAAVRVLAKANPKALVETLLGYVPFADNEVVLDEVRLALMKNALQDGKANPRLVSALSDRAPTRRALAAEVLGQAAYADNKSALRKMLQDGDPIVRYRVAQTLAYAKERDVIPTLIDTLPELPLNTAWQAEDFLLRLSVGHAPPSAPLGNDKTTREKCQAAWSKWWKANGAKIDLAKLEASPKLLGRTLIVLLDQGRVLELGPDNEPRWEIKNIVFPLDAQLIGDDRVLVAEYHANRVSERNLRGEIVWQKILGGGLRGGIDGGPLAAQRLPNGNTFIVTDHQFLEYDKNDKEVVNVSFEGEGRKIMKAMKLPNGEIAALLVDSRIVRYDATGKELHSFSVEIGMRLFGGRIHMLPTGRVLVPHNAEGKVVEYDSKGKIVWQVACQQPIAAMRLPNGNTLITSMDPSVGAVEFDRTGREVWSYRDVNNTRVTRAIRR